MLSKEKESVMYTNKRKYLLFISLLVGLFAIFTTVSVYATVGQDELYYENDILGVALNYPAEYQIIEQQYLSDAYGFAVVDSDKNPVFEVSWLREAESKQTDQLAEETITKFPSVTIAQTSIQVDQRNGIMLSPVPGVVTNLEIYVSAHDRLYTLRYYNDSLDDLGWSLVNSVRFYSPRQSLNDLQLIHADDVIFIPKHLEQELQPDGSEKLPLPNELPESISPTDSPMPSSIQSGCTYYAAIVQTQWASGANNTGWSTAGPRFYGEGSGPGAHVDCNSNTSYNDYYAIDHPLDEWDLIYPHKYGTVIYAGWADSGWSTLGRMVIIDYGGGYWGVMTHLKYISYNAQVGNAVWSNTVIGYAGGSGNYQDNYWVVVHLHQSINKDAKLSINPDGIYDGQSARPNGYQYFGNGGGIYWAWDLWSGKPMSY